jgi:fimbrial isopeptide formation D2 family protein
MHTGSKKATLLLIGVSLALLSTLFSQIPVIYANEPAALTPSPQPQEPTDPPSEPTDPPTEPTDPPTEPTNPPTEPTDPPAEPTDTGGGGGGGEPDRSVDLAIDKQVDPPTVQVGDIVTFVLVVTHAAGGGRADDVVIEDTLPDFLELLEAGTSWGDVTTSGNTVQVTIDRLFPGDVVTVTIRARVLREVGSPENRNVASVIAANREGNTENNTDIALILFPRSDGGDGDDDESTPLPTSTGTTLATTTATAGVLQTTATVTATAQLTPTPTATPLPTPTILPIVLPETGIEEGNASESETTPRVPVALPQTGEAQQDMRLWLLPLALALMSSGLGIVLMLRRTNRTDGTKG